MVIVLTCYSNDPSSNQAESTVFSTKILFEKNENKQIEDGVGTFKKGSEKVFEKSILFSNVMTSNHAAIRVYSFAQKQYSFLKLPVGSRSIKALKLLLQKTMNHYL